MAGGLLLLSRMTAATTIAGASLAMLILGLGLGMVMQVLVIAVQNAVDYRDLGVATSGATLFRLIGGSLGTAIFGAIFANRLAANLASTLPAGAGTANGASLTPQMLAELPSSLRSLYVLAITHSLNTVFLTAAVLAVIGFAAAWLVPERPLREVAAANAGDVGLESGAALDHANSVDPARLHDAAAELAREGLLIPANKGRHAEITAAGGNVLEKLVEARRERLTAVLEDATPGRRHEMAALADRLARELVPDSTAGAVGHARV